MLHALFGFQGRMRRSSYIGALIGVAFAEIAIFFAIGWFVSGGKWPGSDVTNLDDQSFGVALIFGWLAMLPLVIWSHLALGVKRCHDRGYSGWMLLLGAIPFIGWLWAFIDLWFIDGTPGPNRFGPSPKDIVIERHAPAASPRAPAEGPSRVAATVIKESVEEDGFFEAAAKEVESGTINQGLWTRLLIHHDGDEGRTKLSYIKARVETLRAEARANAELEAGAEERRRAKANSEAAAIIARLRPKGPK